MNELIDFLKINEFKTFIVSGGGIDFVREVLSNVYGIPPDQIVGSSIKFKYINGTNRGNSTIIREPELASFNQKGSKTREHSAPYRKRARIYCRKFRWRFGDA